jgi:FkbM family methyltransferase
MNIILDETKMTQGFIMHLADKGEEYEPEVCEFLRSVLLPGDNFVDVGAHIGYFTILASALVLGGKVVAFEPEEDNYDYLMTNIEENGYTNTTAFQVCCGDENKDVELILNLDNDGGHSLYDPGTHPFNTRTRKNERVKQIVPMVTLDSVIGFEPKAIKIDVEGCELKVLKGAEGILKQWSPILIIEMNLYSLTDGGTSPLEVEEYLKSLGYIGYALTTGKRIDIESMKKSNFAYVFNVAFVRVYESLYKEQKEKEN